MAWWQKKLLRYALARTGLLDETALDPDNLDITLGKRNVVELKDVGLNIKKISKLAQLPPGLRLETARVLSLRLIVPSDIYRSSIEAEVDGVELSLRFEQQAEKDNEGEKETKRARAPVTVRSPQHRKVHRRLHSPPPYDPGGLEDSEEETLPTTDQLAKSFLLEEPVQERRELEASVAADAKGLEESIASESSNGDDIGTGATIGLPRFLAGFLQGIADRLNVGIKNVEAKLETELPGVGQSTVPVELRLKVGHAELAPTDADGHINPANEQDRESRRRINLKDLSLDIVSDAATFSDLSEFSSRESPTESRYSGPSSPIQRSSKNSSLRPTSSSAHQSVGINDRDQKFHQSHTAMQESILTADADRFADAGEDDLNQSLGASQSQLDIRPGDDNISWGSRRRESRVPADDLWSSMISEDDLPESLLFDRAHTPRAHSSANVSSGEARNHRSPSPYSRNLQSPGSWPQLDESSHHHLQPQHSPGSWPTLDHASHSMFQSFQANDQTVSSNFTDNRRTALESTLAEPDELDDPPTPTPEAVEDLTTSRVFTHEEAESMYMSALSPSSRMHIPGGWGSESGLSEPSAEEEGKKQPPNPRTESTARKASVFDDDLAYGERPYFTPKAPLSGNVTPRGRSPDRTTIIPNPGESRGKSSRELFHVDTVSLLLPTREGSHTEPELASAPASASRSFIPPGMPSTFSQYSDVAASQRKSAVLTKDGRGSVLWASQENVPNDNVGSSIGIQVGSIKCQLDVPSGRLMHRMISQAAVLVKGSEVLKDEQKTASAAGEASGRALTISVQDVWIAIRESADLSLRAADATKHCMDNTITLDCRVIEFASNPGKNELRLGSFQTFLGTSCFISFNRSRELRTSMTISDQTPDISVVLADRKGSFNHPITAVTVDTLPLEILLDLPIIDDAFGSFGGLSGVLDTGNSILSESGIGSSPASHSKPIKGVHFEGDPTTAKTEPELKINARLGAVDATLRGSTCSVQLRTTTVKAVYREQGAVATIEQVILAGPYISEGNTTAVSVDFSTLRLEYLASPQDRDLERLLSLLTPSKDKYDTDEDILIDTLIMQRRKGALARASVTRIEFKCRDLDSLAILTSLSDELSKLSAVAKYLPEDDRPGLLTLIRVKDCEASLPVNDRFGDVLINLSDLHLAHVGLPAMLALSVGGVQSSQSGKGSLVHALAPLSGSENLPMLMARTLGDEVDPTFKVKLFNVCVEYSVPVLLDLTNLDKEVGAEEIVAEMAKSVANLALPVNNAGLTPSGPANEVSGPKTKRTKLHLLVHDSAIALSPQSLPSRGLLVLTDATASSTIPFEESLAATFELRQAGLFLTDQIVIENAEVSSGARGSPSNTAVQPKLTLALSEQGYISIGSIMAAKITTRVKQPADNGAKCVDVDVKNKLLLLETCADSTQTLIAVLNGLAPPTPPSKQPKYLTEPMTIQDMMASFTGAAYTEPERPNETLFDVEEEPSDDPDLLMDAPMFEKDGDGLLAGSEVTSSLYGPVYGVMEAAGRYKDDTEADDYHETVESLLEDDPFEMPSSPTDSHLSDSALLRELGKQCKPTVQDEAMDLGLYEIEDLGYDALGGTQTALGTQYRFNTPATATTGRPSAMSQEDLPFKLQLRDVHVIWNIYDGYDWQRTRNGITKAVEQVEIKAEQRKAKRRQSLNEQEDEESVIDDFLFNSIYIGVASNHDAQELRRQINRKIDDRASETDSVPMSGISRPTTNSASGRPVRQRQRRRLKLERSESHKIAFELKGFSADVLVFSPESSELVSSVDLRVREFEIFDNVPTSTWRKFLTHLNNDPSGREMGKPMMHIEIFNVRTLENFAASEIALHASILPLRLHVDQDALDFITRFFEFKDESIMPTEAGGEQPFLQRVEVETVDLCLDYKPKKVDYVGLRSGHTTEFMNFIILDAANIRLKHAIVYGINGFEPLHKTLNDVWMPDIKRNQLPTVLAGLAPVRSLVNIGSGVRDVVAIPIREYRKDGRIVRSVQKGAFQFGKTTASELARLGAKVAMGTQNLLQGAEGLLSPSSASPSGRQGVGLQAPPEQGWHDVVEEEGHEQRAISAYASQPLGVFAGLKSARQYLEHDLLTARDALIAVQGEVMESSSPGSAAAAVARHAPTVILRPFIGASRAIGTSLLGAGNAIDQGNIRRTEDKYKRR